MAYKFKQDDKVECQTPGDRHPKKAVVVTSLRRTNCLGKSFVAVYVKYGNGHEGEYREEFVKFQKPAVMSLTKAINLVAQDLADEAYHNLMSGSNHPWYGNHTGTAGRVLATVYEQDDGEIVERVYAKAYKLYSDRIGSYNV